MDLISKNDYVKENANNEDVIRQYIAKQLSKNGIEHNVRPKDKNISILRGRNAVAFIDFGVECKEYGYPVARLRESARLLDPRIVPYSPDGNCKYSKRKRKLSDEKFDIGIIDDSALELAIKAFKNISF